MVAAQAETRELTREEALPRILPSIRPTAYMELSMLMMRAQGHEDNPATTYEPFAPGLFIMLSLDFEENVQAVTKEQLDEWGLDFDTALERAVTNLREMTPPDALRQVDDGLYVSEVSDCYDCSRLLLPELLREPQVAGELVAVLPSWHTLILTGSDEVRGLEAAMAFAEEAAAESPRPISGLPLVYRWPNWERLEIPPGHPNHNRYQRMKAIEMNTYYEQQKGLLDQIHEQNGTDVFVASYAAFEKEGLVTSHCTWTQGVPTLLPEADIVAFVRDAPEEPDGMETAGMVSFDIVRRICGELMQPTEYDPPRWFVDAYPDSERMNAMLQAQKQRAVAD